SNIVFTARQAMELTDRRVHVVPTRTGAAGVAAMMAYTPGGDPKTVPQTMGEAAEQVRPGEIACAVRDSEAWEVAVRAGDCIGLTDGEIRAAGPDPEATVLAALEQLVSPDDSLISIYYGQDVSEETAQALAARVRSQRSEERRGGDGRADRQRRVRHR